LSGHDPFQRVTAIVDLGAVERNCAALAGRLGDGADLCAVVKADGYGHGMGECADAALRGGATRLAVATATEAFELRERVGAAVPIFVMGALTGAEAATVVNNNAAATLIALNTLAAGREVLISRGQLVEIGGSFRMPDVFKAAGVVLREVGTTNRTHRRDYADAIGPSTGLLLRVHPSNFRTVGFTAEVPLAELIGLGKAANLPVMDDLGAGALVPIEPEPEIGESLSLGADLVTCSGDKLIGGPQCGILLGKLGWIDRVRRNPLFRALRVDKMTLCALEATLGLFLAPGGPGDGSAVRHQLGIGGLHGVDHGGGEVAEKGALDTEDAADDFVAGHHGVNGVAPVIAGRVQVRVTNPTVADFDHHIVRTRRAAFELKRRQVVGG